MAQLSPTLYFIIFSGEDYRIEIQSNKDHHILNSKSEYNQFNPTEIITF